MPPELMTKGSPEIATRNSRPARDGDRRNDGKRVWSDLAQHATDEINADPGVPDRLRDSRDQAQRGQILWERDDSDTE